MAVEYILYNERQLGGVVAFLVRRAGADQVVAARVARRRNREHDGCVWKARGTLVLSEALPMEKDGKNLGAQTMPSLGY